MLPSWARAARWDPVEVDAGPVSRPLDAVPTFLTVIEKSMVWFTIGDGGSSTMLSTIRSGRGGGPTLNATAG